MSTPKFVLINMNDFCPTCQKNIKQMINGAVTKKVKAKAKAKAKRKVITDLKKYKHDFYIKKRNAKLMELVDTNPEKILRLIKRGGLRRNTTLAIKAMAANPELTAKILAKPPKPSNRGRKKLTATQDTSTEVTVNLTQEQQYNELLKQREKAKRQMYYLNQKMNKLNVVR